MTQAVQLSATSVEHYGPEWLADMVVDAFGGPIDLDPASCPQANLLIRASTYYTQAQNGLALPWYGAVYLNPPGGRCTADGLLEVKRGGVNRAGLWWATLVHRYHLGMIRQAMFMVFNLELFRYAQDWAVAHPSDFPICYPKQRIDFWKPGDNGPVPQGQPGHPNAIIYMGPREAQFRQVFKSLGKVTAE